MYRYIKKNIPFQLPNRTEYNAESQLFLIIMVPYCEVTLPEGVNCDQWTLRNITLKICLLENSTFYTTNNELG